MKEKIDFKFCFKGSRTYIHGTDIYNQLIKKLGENMIDEKFDLSFHGIAKRNIDLSFVKPEDVATIKFVCKYFDKNNKRNILYGFENTNNINCRYKYPEEDIYKLSKLNIDKKEVSLMEETSFTFVENTVAINKYLLENLFPQISGKWYFTRFQISYIPTNKAYPLKLVLKANFNFKLTKTEIFIKNKSCGFIYFSLV